MIQFENRAIDDLESIRQEDGHEVMLMLFEWCHRLDDASTRIMAERLGRKPPIFRLRVEDFHINFLLVSDNGVDAVRITRVRRRHRKMPPL